MCCPQRFVVMPLICLYILSFYTMTTSPGAIQHAIINYFGLDNGQYSAFYSVSSWASLFDVLHGYLIEKWLGLKLAALIYASVILFGNVLYIAAGYLKIFWLLILGRVIFGLGGNPLILCMNGFILHWFAEKEINLTYALNTSVTWLGSSAIFFVSVRLMNYIRSLNPVDPEEGIRVTICLLTVVITFVMVLSSSAISLLYKRKDGIKVKENIPPNSNDEIVKEKEKTFKTLLSFPLVYWLFAVSTFLLCVSIMSFIAMSQVYFKTTYGLSIEKASNLSSLLNLLSAVLSPPIGLLVDKVGRNLTFFSLSLISGFISHSLFAFTTINPVIPVIFLSLSAGLASSIWSMFGYLADENQQIMAYGIAQTGVNGAIAVGSLVAGFIVDSFGYRRLEIFFVCVLGCSLVLMVFIWMLDHMRGGILNLSQQERSRRIKIKNSKSDDLPSTLTVCKINDGFDE